jgi:hypothetical protein
MTLFLLYIIDEDQWYESYAPMPSNYNIIDLFDKTNLEEYINKQPIANNIFIRFLKIEKRTNIVDRDMRFKMSSFGDKRSLDQLILLDLYPDWVKKTEEF